MSVASKKPRRRQGMPALIVNDKHSLHAHHFEFTGSLDSHSCSSMNIQCPSITEVGEMAIPPLSAGEVRRYPIVTASIGGDVDMIIRVK